MNETLQLLQTAAEPFGISLTDNQLQQFGRYQALLIEWNQRLNLTRIIEPHDIIIRHFLDSLTCATVMGEVTDQKVIDVGTGAGFPGLPLKILYPDIHLTLVDSVTKKTTFLAAVVEALGLTAVTISDGRAEEIGQQPAYREQYDWVVARSVAEMRILAEYLLPLGRVGGYLLAQKGENAAEEVKSAYQSIRILGGGRVQMHEVRLPDHELTHHLVVIPKERPTPKKYPRRPGLPSKRPL
ncbi:MAG: 16S rRNA (guanine(527)-N(7))-methyltransferase RsmG [Anaerolineales bacterium]|nr:16S rRNA (guanine(527)-N(7))-methyltransferase RsmG [Anaerolineales bacterium]